MKAIKIDRSGAVELVEGTFEELCDESVTWDGITLERNHSIYFDDFGLSASDAMVAKISVYPNVPLPAIVLGLDGENDVDVRFTVDEVAAMVSDVRAAR